MREIVSIALVIGSWLVVMYVTARHARVMMAIQRAEDTNRRRDVNAIAEALRWIK